MKRTIYNGGRKRPADRREERIEREIRLHLNARMRGRIGYELGEVHLNRAIAFGLEVGQVIQVGAEKFRLVDNSTVLQEKGKVYRASPVTRYELEEVKDPKPKKTKAEAASPVETKVPAATE
jgi:hypothetical protein